MSTMVIDNEHAAHAGKRITFIGAAVNVLLVLVKLTVGYLGNSRALVADAIHSLSDLFSDGIVLLGLHWGRRGPDADHHYGHGRIETIASAIVGITLLTTAVFLTIDAWKNILTPPTQPPTSFTLFAAAIAILLKEILYRRTLALGRKFHSMALMANAWHHRSDALSSLVVFAGIAGTQIDPRLILLDPIAAIFVSLFIIKVGLRILWQAVRELTDVAPAKEVMENIKSTVKHVEGVQSVHGLKGRTTSGVHMVQVDVVVNPLLTVTEGHKIAKQVKQTLYDSFPNIGEVIVHVDPDPRTSDPDSID